MSYTPTQWKDGDLVTSAKLNKMEQGIAAGGGILIIHEDENGVLDKTWQEIYDAKCGIIISEYADGIGCIIITGIYISDNVYCIGTNIREFTTDEPNSYPQYININDSPGGGLR